VELLVDMTARMRSMYVANVGALHAYAARRVGRDLADDVTAETFRRAIESFDRFDPTLGTERAWLFGIATNVLRKHRRAELRRLAALAREHPCQVHGAAASLDPLLVVGPKVDSERQLVDVLTAVAELAPDDYDLLVLVAWEGLPPIEVAAALGLPPGTVRSRLHRIRRQLDQARRRDV
jgi:RNA polymerase sigma-70 factor (ECF subfamily)